MIWINFKRTANKEEKEQNWYNWLINYIPDPTKKRRGCYKTKDCSKPRRLKTVYGSGKKQSEKNLVKSLRN